MQTIVSTLACGKVELLIISALQPCHRSLQAKRPEVERRTSWLYLVFSEDHGVGSEVNPKVWTD